MKKRIILLILGLLINMFIWINSLMPASISSEQSGFIVKIIYPIFEKRIDINNFTIIIRKLAHITEYMILAFVLGLLYSDIIYKKYSIITIIHILITAIIDEVIQIFVDGRAGLITDVLFDLIGGLLGILIVIVINKHKHKHINMT